LRRPPLSLYLVTILGLVLATLLIYEGLYIRLFTGFRNPEAIWVTATEKLGIDPIGLGWPWLVLGISWVSAVCGVWLKLPWGRWAMWIVSILSFFYIGIGTILAALVLIGFALPVSQGWIKHHHVSDIG
jgi:hypothetical protein